MYLDARGDGRAKQVAEYLRQRFYVAAAHARPAGTLSGFRPYYGTGTPDVIWSEGTIEAVARASTASASTKSAAADAVTRLLRHDQGRDRPGGADRDVVSVGLRRVPHVADLGRGLLAADPRAAAPRLLLREHD